MHKITFKQLVLSGFLATVVCVLILGISSYISIKNLQDNEEQESRTEWILLLSHKVQQQLLDAESNERAYVTTGKRVYFDK